VAPPVTAAAINISIANASTKEEWMDQAVAAFNAAALADGSWQVDGRPVRVEVLCETGSHEKKDCKHYRSGPMVQNTINGTIKPAIISPGEESWVVQLKDQWRSVNRKEISTGEAPVLARTPLVIAMWQSRAQALGCWPVARPECTWERVRSLANSPDGWASLGHADWGKFKFGYGYVGESNSGTLTAVLTCMVGAGKTAGLALSDVTADSGCGRSMHELEKAKVHSGVRSDWLLGHMERGGPEYLDAMTTNEKEVIEFNQKNGAKLREPLVAAYPQDATVVVGQPCAVLDGAPWVSEEQAKAAGVFCRFLLSREQQALLLPYGLRPADPTAQLGPPIEARYGANPQANLAAVALPETMVVNQIIEVWHQVKKHSNIVLVFDKSGSMQGEKITEAVKGACSFVGAMDREDWPAWRPFDDKLYGGTQGLKRDVGEALCESIRATAAGGGTALYDSVADAYLMLEARRKTQGDSVKYGIVVLSDGRDTNSMRYTQTQLLALLQPNEKDPSSIQIHTIGIGADADDTILTRLAVHGQYWRVKDTADVVGIYPGIAKYF
jgi:Ca-activated chloride channel family protein